MGPRTSLKLLMMFSFYYSFLKHVMLTLLLFPCAVYSGDPCKSRWNETSGSTACNYSKGDLLYSKFSKLKQLWIYLQLRVIHDFDIFIFFKNSHQKSEFFQFFKKPLFSTEWSSENEYWRVLSDLTRLSQNVVSQLFSQYCQIYINLKIKSC